jgi:hypothetical protein
MVRLVKTCGPLILTVVVCVLGGAPASAEPIRVVAGGFVWPDDRRLAVVSIEGASEGFTYSGRGSTIFGRFAPLETCDRVVGCRAGTLVPLLTQLDTSILGGVATYQGATYPVRVSAHNENAGIFLTWLGEVQLPADFGGGTVSVPFTFSGHFQLPTDPRTSPLIVPLFGNGVASLTFDRSVVPQLSHLFNLSSARYDFTAAEPVPGTRVHAAPWNGNGSARGSAPAPAPAHIGGVGAR